MPILNVRNIGSVGVVSDIAPWDLPPEALSDGINFRLSANKLQSVGGTKPVAPAIGDQLGHINQSKDFSNNSTWVVCGESNIYLYDGSAYTPIAGSLSRSESRFKNLDSTLWSTAKIGQVVFFNHPQLYPLYWVDDGNTGGDVKPLPWHQGAETWADKGYSCKMIRAHKNFLFALGMQEGADDFPDKVWWSNPALPNGIPFSWRPPSEQPDSIAGYVSLGRGGSIVSGDSLRDSFVIYSEQAINMMDFTGDALMWRRRSISSSAGMASPESLVEVQGMHYFITPGDVQMFDGNSVQSLMHNRLRKRFASRVNFDAVNKSWAAHNPAFTEIWFAVPEESAEHPKSVYAFNYRDGNWSIRDLEMEFRHAHFGYTPTVSATSWQSMPGTWDNTKQSWNMSSDSPFETSLLGVTADEIHDIDVLNEYFDTEYKGSKGEIWSTAIGSWSSQSLTWDEIDPRLNYSRSPTIIRRTDMPIGGHDVNTTITRLYPLMDGTAPIDIRVGSQQMAGGPIKWAGGYRRFTPGEDRKIDVRTTGEVHCYEIKAEGGAFFSLTGMDIEYSPAGAR